MVMGAAVLDGCQPRARRQPHAARCARVVGEAGRLWKVCRSVINCLRVGRRAADGRKEGFEKDNLDQQIILLR